MDEDTKFLRGARRHISATVIFALLACAAISCTPGEKQAVNTAIDIAGYACIIANADLTDESLIAKACKIEQVLGPDIKKVVDDFKGKRAAYAKEQMAAQHCAK